MKKGCNVVKKIILILVLLLALIGAINAETLNMLQLDRLNTTYASFCFDPGFMAGIGYVRGFNIEPINRILCLSVEFTLPIFLFDFRNYKVDVGFRFPFLRSEWNIINRFSVLNKGISNAVFTGNMVSVEEGLLGGYFSKKWYLAIEANYEKFLIIYMKHSEYYRSIFPGVQDGWYKSTGGKWRFALQGGYTFMERVEPTIRMGTYWHEGFSLPVFSMPIFAEIVVNIHF